MRAFLRSFSFILNHPLSQRDRGSAIGRYIRWQIGSRILAAPVQMPFVNETVLVVTPGMTGATQNLYTGLADFGDCAFLLHLLRKDDLFIDIGSNVGVYSVLASGAVGAKSIAIEPIPQTYARLCANIRANDISDRTLSHNIGLGRSDSTLRFTVDQDCMNHIISDENWMGPSIHVPVRTLNAVAAGLSPVLCKLDVEGWESEVLAGGTDVLENRALLGLIIEMDGSKADFNPNEHAVHACMLGNGFAPFTYDPFTRKLTSLPSKNRGGANTLYLRNLSAIQARLASAPPFVVNGRAI